MLAAQLGSKRNFVIAGFSSAATGTALRGFQKLFRRRVTVIPPRIRRPINWRAVAAWRPALQPELSDIIFPDADGMAVKFFPTMQTPMLLFEIGPLAADAVCAQEVQFLVVRKRNVFGHGKLRSPVADFGDSHSWFPGAVSFVNSAKESQRDSCSEPKVARKELPWEM